MKLFLNGLQPDLCVHMSCVQYNKAEISQRLIWQEVFEVRGIKSIFFLLFFGSDAQFPVRGLKMYISYIFKTLTLQSTGALKIFIEARLFQILDNIK